MAEDFNGAKVALFVGDRLISILRDDKPDIPFPNMWDFPGGGREGAETPIETVARETLEELSVMLPRSAVVWERRYMWSSTANAPSWFFVARLPEGAVDQIRLGDEGQRWDMMTPDDYLGRADAIPNMQARLRDWLATA